VDNGNAEHDDSQDTPLGNGKQSSGDRWPVRVELDAEMESFIAL
jgi:hypothetical protein